MAPLDARPIHGEKPMGVKKPPSWRPTRSVCGDMFDRQYQLLQRELGPHKHGSHAKALGHFCRHAYIQGRIAEEKQIEEQKRINTYFEKGPVKRQSVADACRPANGHSAHWRACDSVARCFDRHIPPIEATDSDVRFQEYCERMGQGQAKPRPQSAPVAPAFRLNCPYYPERAKDKAKSGTIELMLDTGCSLDSYASGKVISEKQRPASAFSGIRKSMEHPELSDKGSKPRSMHSGIGNTASTPALQTHAQVVIESPKNDQWQKMMQPRPRNPSRKGIVLEWSVSPGMKRRAFKARKLSDALSPCPPPPTLEDL